MKVKDGNWHVQVDAACKKKKGVLGLGKKCKKDKYVKAIADCYQYDQTP